MVRAELRVTLIREEKGTQTQTFWSGYFRVGWGVFHVKGWGPKSSVCPSKPRETKLFGGISWDFAGISPGGARRVREKKACVQFLGPMLKPHQTLFLLGKGETRTILFCQARQVSPKRKFWAGYSCGHPVQHFGQALQIRIEQRCCDYIQESPRQTKPKKGQLVNFSQGHSGTKVHCGSCLFS